MTIRKGFVDLQVNGYFGIDFAEPGLTVEQVRRVVLGLVKERTVALCPTIITSPLEVFESNLPVLARCFEEEDLRPHLLGIHLEGPFLSPEDGARGAHDRRWVVDPDIGLFQRLRTWANDRLCLVTLAPERPGALELIRHARAAGAVVSLGHHLADRETVARACEAGAVASTHLGNGIPNLLSRHPNPLWAQLDEERLTAMVITDGHHTPPEFIRTVLRVKDVERFVAVSDAVSLGGLPPGTYRTLGQEAVLEETGLIWNPKGGHLVGSSATMKQCVDRLAAMTDLSEGDLWRVGLENPLRLLGRKLDVEALRELPDLRFENRRFV